MPRRDYADTVTAMRKDDEQQPPLDRGSEHCSPSLAGGSVGRRRHAPGVLERSFGLLSAEIGLSDLVQVAVIPFKHASCVCL